ncbi:MAG: Rrf2 family transcriptional regulator [Sphingobium sp.]|nr:Rrf2 family transcriptional regulator [Sphingobium sp.]MCP5398333.1 Rrf2 family transcriptional regulator [Sphingomonas sp.]
MRITSYSDYALRVLMYLGINPERLCTIAEIAERYDISKPHVMKIVHELGRSGLIETVRGRSGGIRLGRPAEAIVIGEVLRETEPDFAIVPCFESAKSCQITPHCELKRAMSEAVRAFLSVLDRYTLSDLIAKPEGLLADLSLDAS